MNYDYTIKIDLEESEKEAIRTLARTYNDCTMDDRIECDDCPFKNGNTCIPHDASLFEIREGKQL